MPDNMFMTSRQRTNRRKQTAAAFTLVELLTVVFIISLLIGILIPSINAARTAAKKSATANKIRAIEAGLEMFKNENEKDYRQTNGYPPSFAHPPLRPVSFDAYLGQFPFLDPTSSSAPPRAYGAQWLTAMLLGADGLGYVKKSAVPSSLRAEPWCWYPNPDADLRGCTNDRPDSVSSYLDPNGVRIIAPSNIPGSPSEVNGRLFPDWSTAANSPASESLPVILDDFEQPILYYAARTHGRDTNYIEDIRTQNNSYTGGEQQEGTPFYFHQDNEGFTGTDAGVSNLAGWNFGGVNVRAGERLHPISEHGADFTAADISTAQQSFAAYILDRRILQGVLSSTSATNIKKLKPVNANSYLLISAGPDGRYGTSDDVNNLPDKLE